jgi:hypothetical protein
MSDTVDFDRQLRDYAGLTQAQKALLKEEIVRRAHAARSRAIASFFKRLVIWWRMRPPATLSDAPALCDQQPRR